MDTRGWLDPSHWPECHGRLSAVSNALVPLAGSTRLFQERSSNGSADDLSRIETIRHQPEAKWVRRHCVDGGSLSKAFISARLLHHGDYRNPVLLHDGEKGRVLRNRAVSGCWDHLLV